MTQQQTDAINADYKIVVIAWRFLKEWSQKDCPDWYEQMSDAMLKLYSDNHGATYDFTHGVINAAAREVIRIHDMAIGEACDSADADSGGKLDTR